MNKIPNSGPPPDTKRMNIHIESPIPDKHRKGLRKWASPRRYISCVPAFLTQPFGMTCFSLFLTLLVTEHFCLRESYTENETFLLGSGGTACGFFFIIFALRLARIRWKDLYGQSFTDRTRHPYLTLNDEYLERGVAGLWRQRFNWQMLESFTERKARFILQLKVKRIIIEKRDLKDETSANEIRAFLAGKIAAR